MTSSQLQEYARFGAEARLHSIEEERDAIMRAFPDLGRSSGRTNGASPPAARRKGMSPSQRKAVGARMKAYWAKRRAEKTGDVRAEETPSGPAKRKGMSVAARKAQGERMRAYWAARRAEEHTAAVAAQTKAAGSSSRKPGQKAARRKGRKKYSPWGD